jgi:uncharacterized protein (TIGR00251 family)
VAAPNTRLRVRVAAGARSSAIVGRHGDGWKVRVSAPPERGRANDAVVGVIAQALGVARKNVKLVGGAAARDKVFELTGLSLAEANRRLAQAGGTPL